MRFLSADSGGMLESNSLKCKSRNKFHQIINDTQVLQCAKSDKLWTNTVSQPQDTRTKAQ